MPLTIGICSNNASPIIITLVLLEEKYNSSKNAIKHRQHGRSKNHVSKCCISLFKQLKSLISLSLLWADSLFCKLNCIYIESLCLGVMVPKHNSKG